VIAEAHVDPWPLKRLLDGTEGVSEQFFNRNTIELAKALLGCVLLHNETAGMIVETEAYLGKDDLAAHSSRGVTERTKVIFGPPGRAYVYFIYGMHECLNIVAEPDGVAGCVLLRALDPLTGIGTMRERRRWSGSLCGLTNGPGKLTSALDINRNHYGVRMFEGPLTIRTFRQPHSFVIEDTPRIGIRECADWPLRFVWRGHPCLTRRTPA
jgi:DNA-3-methyladenine glycosylase